MKRAALLAALALAACSQTPPLQDGELRTITVNGSSTGVLLLRVNAKHYIVIDQRAGLDVRQEIIVEDVK